MYSIKSPSKIMNFNKKSTNKNSIVCSGITSSNKILSDSNKVSRVDATIDCNKRNTFRIYKSNLKSIYLFDFLKIKFHFVGSCGSIKSYWIIVGINDPIENHHCYYYHYYCYHLHHLLGSQWLFWKLWFFKQTDLQSVIVLQTVESLCSMKKTPIFVKSHDCIVSYQKLSNFLKPMIQVKTNFYYTPY